MTSVRRNVYPQSRRNGDSVFDRIVRMILDTLDQAEHYLALHPLFGRAHSVMRWNLVKRRARFVRPGFLQSLMQQV